MSDKILNREIRVPEDMERRMKNMKLSQMTAMQGETTITAMQGEAMIELMNAMEYDVSIPGITYI